MQQDNTLFSRLQVTAEDIPVTGRLVSISSENVVADASLVWDSNLLDNQQNLNQANKDRVDALSTKIDTDIADIREDVETRFAEIKTYVNTQITEFEKEIDAKIETVESKITETVTNNVTELIESRVETIVTEKVTEVFKDPTDELKEYVTNLVNEAFKDASQGSNTELKQYIDNIINQYFEQPDDDIEDAINTIIKNLFKSQDADIKKYIELYVNEIFKDASGGTEDGDLEDYINKLIANAFADSTSDLTTQINDLIAQYLSEHNIGGDAAADARISALETKATDLDSRVTTLESTTSTLLSNYTSLQTAVTALLNKEEVTVPTKLSEFTDDVTIKSEEVNNTTITLKSGVYADITSTGDLTLTIGDTVEDKLNLFEGSFDTGDTAPTITWPADVNWGESELTVEANKHYEFSIRYVRGTLYGLMYSWD